MNHPSLDPYRDLDRSKRSLDSDLFVGEGRLVVQRMLESDFEIQSVLLGEEIADSQSIIDRMPKTADLIRLSKPVISQLVGFDFHAGILACGKRKRVTRLEQFEQLLRRRTSTVVVCPFTVLPDNLGSIMRLCCGFGAEALVVGSRSADPYSRRAIRVSMGNVFRLNVVQPPSIAEVLADLKRQYGFQLLAATGSDKGTSLPIDRPSERIAIVLGNEADGIDTGLVQMCDLEVSIPMSGGTDSLNVANAAAILLYQFTRHRQATDSR